MDSVLQANELFSVIVSQESSRFLGRDSSKVRASSRAISAKQLRREVKRVNAKVGPDGIRTLLARTNLAEELLARGRCRAARAQLETVLGQVHSCSDTPEAFVAHVQYLLGSIMQSLGKLEFSRKLLESALDYYDRPEVPDVPALYETLKALSQTVKDQGKLELARSLRERTVAMSCEIRGEADLQTARARSAVSAICRLSRDFASARELDALSLELAHAVNADAAQKIGIMRLLVLDYMGLAMWQEAAKVARDAIAAARLLPNDPDSARWRGPRGRCVDWALAPVDKEEMTSHELAWVKRGLRVVAGRSGPVDVPIGKGLQRFRMNIAYIRRAWNGEV